MIRNVIKKYQLAVYIALSITIIGIIMIILLNLDFDKTKLEKFENDYYTLTYDNSWYLKEKTKNNILLNNGKKANINIDIIGLKDESRYSSIEELIDEVVYSIEKQNANYKLLFKESTKVSKYEYEGFKLLYENKDSQVMTTVYKKSDKLIMINYECYNEYFDILLDSVQNIIYNFDTKEKRYDLISEITIDTKEAKYSSDDELDNKLKGSKTYEIANNNYYVKYSIPSNFELGQINSQSNYFNLKGIDGKNIKISTNIYNRNIYEALDEKDGILDDYDYYKKSEDYSDFNETLTKIDNKSDDDIETYLYKNSFIYNKAITYDKDFNVKKYKRKDENAKLIYALNKNHVLIIDIETVGTGITKKLLDEIKIEDIKNYSSYTTSTKKDGMLIGNLRRFSNYDRDKIDEIVIQIPDKYVEIQDYNNVFEERKYGLNFDEDKDIYDYEIKYHLTTTSSDIERELKSINSFFSISYGDYKYLTKSKNITLNNHDFIVYDGGYTDLGGIFFTNINRFKYYVNEKVLFYKISNGGYLVIEISGNGKKITDDILNDVSNFSAKEIDN